MASSETLVGHPRGMGRGVMLVVTRPHPLVCILTIPGMITVCVVFILTNFSKDLV